MTDEKTTTPSPPPTVMPEQIQAANAWLVEYMQRTLEDGRTEVAGLRDKFAWTYWIIIVLSIIMFCVGIILISVPALAALRGDMSSLQSVIAAGFGIADLVALFFFRPIERLHKTMGDMGQITIALNGFQTQVALRLLELNSTDRISIGKAAKHVEEAAQISMELIQSYFEEKKVKHQKPVLSKNKPPQAPS